MSESTHAEADAPGGDAAQRRRMILSALADGELPAPECDGAIDAWREHDDLRATWHAWQLIGDVLRREDLAQAPARDQSLLAAVRARLADEPVVLAPSAREEAVVGAEAAARRRPRAATGGVGAWARQYWQGPAAMAAGFLLVAGGLMWRPAGTSAPAPGPAVAAATPSAPMAGAANGATAVLTREQVAPYLAAHRQWGGPAPLQMPDAGLRNVSLVQPAR